MVDLDEVIRGGMTEQGRDERLGDEIDGGHLGRGRGEEKEGVKRRRPLGLDPPLWDYLDPPSGG